MLTQLRVRNLGVIDDLEVSFGPGVTALTGETGAGKTLLVEALQLVLGGRASPGLVRAGADEAVVEARFTCGPGTEPGSGPGSGPGSELGTGATETVLARSVPAAGRSRSWVDGHMVPVAALAEAGADLVDIHGQHDHQSLSSPSGQRRALDEFAGADLEPRRRARRRLAEIDAALAALGGDERQRAREGDVLRHQVAEIDAAALGDVDGEDEEAALRDEESRLADLSAHRQAAALALGELDGDVEPGGGGTGATVLELLARATAALGGRPALAPWAVRLRDAMAELGDLSSDLRHVVDTWEDDPERLAQVHDRLHLLADLRRKYGPTLAEVAAFGEAARRRLADLERSAEESERLVAERSAAEAALRSAESALGRQRREAAPRLAAAVEARLRTLAMPGARFEVVVGGDGAGDRAGDSAGDRAGDSAGDRAGDDVRFMLGANPGEPLQELSRVASGGELSRAMLALRLVSAGGPATMVFDEVDAGVGGEAARSLAGALREAARGRQVLVVTHLAQVAAVADRQVSIEKTTRAGRTVTAASELSMGERVVELSRMLSGHPDSATARAHAEELLSSARRAATSTTPEHRVD